jgi:hypothetical protein
MLVKRNKLASVTSFKEDASRERSTTESDFVLPHSMNNYLVNYLISGFS